MLPFAGARRKGGPRVAVPMIAALLWMVGVGVVAGFGQKHGEAETYVHAFSFGLPEDTQRFQQSIFMLDDGRVSTATPLALMELKEHKLAPILRKLDKTKGVTNHEKSFSSRVTGQSHALSKNGGNGGSENSVVQTTVSFNDTHHGKAKAEISGGKDIQLTIGDMPPPQNATVVCSFCNMEHGKCVDGECQCEEGWSGKDCTMQGLQEPTCPDWCVPPRGHCTSGPFGRALCQCAVGFGGPDCKEKREMLVFREQHSLPLLHECPKCGSHGKCGAGPWDIPLCYCDKGFSGPTCGDVNPPNPPQGAVSGPGGTESSGSPSGRNNDLTVCAFCSANGECVNGTCKCYFGWTGVDCMDPKPGETPCPDNCNGHGACQDGSCQCVEPYKGAACEDGPCPKDCSGHGTCFEGKCNCDLTWVGADCGRQGNECPNQCSNHGTCQDDKTCKCDKGWGSGDCSKRECPGEGKCSGNGKCTEDGFCLCNEGFDGAACDVKKCINDCNNNGECLQGVCKCNKEWEGTDCSSPKKDVICPKSDAGVCSAHGACNPEEKKCECYPGYAGVACTELECANGCSGHGECKGDKTCSCQEGYFEADCSRYSRGYGCLHECTGHGTCKSGKCECDIPFVGEDCAEMGCPNNCNGNGVCKNGECTCEVGWTGLDCSTDRCPFNCSGHGTCPETGGNCQCDTGYKGIDCSEDVCPRNCSERGRCIENMCVCEPGFSGEDCGTVRGAASGTVLEAMDEAAEAAGNEPTPELSELEPIGKDAAGGMGGWVSGLRSNEGPKTKPAWQVSPDSQESGHKLRSSYGHHRKPSRRGLVKDDDSDEPGYRDRGDKEELDILPHDKA